MNMISKLFNFLLKIFKLLYVIFTNPIFTKPKKSKILFYDGTSTSLIKRRLQKKYYETINIRGENINIIVLTKVLLNFGFSYKAYIHQYISFVEPKVVITCMDNAHIFYTLKKKFPKIIFIAVQNGYRSQYRDFFVVLKNLKKNKLLKKLEADYIFLFGNSICSEYLKYIKFNPISLGSFRNNFAPILKTKEKKNSILFVSSFGKNTYPGNKYFWIEDRLLPLIEDFCFKNSLKLFIAGSSQIDWIDEKKYFSNILSKNQWYFLRKKNWLSNYKLIDKFNVVVFIDSTLGYEAATRNKKVAVFSARKMNKSTPTETFNWSKNTKSKGFFYSDSISKNEVYRVLKNVTLISKKNWKKNYYKFFKEIVNFQPYNRRLFKIIQKHI